MLLHHTKPTTLWDYLSYKFSNRLDSVMGLRIHGNQLWIETKATPDAGPFEINPESLDAQLGELNAALNGNHRCRVVEREGFTLVSWPRGAL